jgi:4-aminobutyrate aminotransferase-like enzyme
MRPRRTESDVNGTPRRALAQGLWFKATMDNTLTLAPPLTIADDELGMALDILKAAFGETEIKLA